MQMRRIQVYLKPDITAALERVAQKRGTSRASLIRLAVRDFVDRQEGRHGSILELAGIGRSGQSDVSERHDDYLAEAMLEEARH
jgi:metal-responsive CopG/Arc/MetJ family transcriptional regulator